MKTYTKMCPNCGAGIHIKEEDLLNNKDEYWGDCEECNCPFEIEIEYDDQDNISKLHIY